MAKTDIESFVEAGGREEKVRAVRQKIDELGVEYLYLHILHFLRDNFYLKEQVFLILFPI